MQDVQAIVNQKSGVIDFNFEEMKDYLKERLKEYDGVVFTDDSIKMAKVILASLRKDQAAFKARVSEVRKEYMKTFEEFKAKADELILLFDEPISLIDAQIKDFESRRKEDKRAEIQNIYDSLSDEEKEYAPLDKIYNPKWENATYKMRDVQNDINVSVKSIMDAVATIKGMNSDAVDSALELYKQHLSLSDAISYINQYEQQKIAIMQREAEKKKQEEEERIRREERERIQHEMQIAEMEKRAEEEKQAIAAQAAAEALEDVIPDLSGESNLYEYRLSLTADAKNKLERYLDSVGIDWEIING